MKLIDKDKIIAQINSMLKSVEHTSHCDEASFNSGRWKALASIKNFLNTLEVKEVDLDNHTIMEEIRKCGCNPSEFDVAKHFFELGLKANQENNVIGTLEREVKIDAGGYPCIDCYIEFYDYEKDIPLAKKGDKVKVIVMKGE